MNVAAIIVGIDGWEKYTLPLIESIAKHESKCWVGVIDNASDIEYPYLDDEIYPRVFVMRTPRLCYSKAINAGQSIFDYPPKPDWYIVLSNDVLCMGPFAHMLEAYGNGDLVGPLLKEVHGFPYLEGWCVCVPAQAWAEWDERFLGSDYEDVAFSTHARQRGYGLIEDKALPFVHLDQQQRYHIVGDFAAKNAHNQALFLREYARVAA